MSATEGPSIPLSAPDGRVYAYACPRCHQAASSMSRSDQGDGPDGFLVGESKRGADSCCRCTRCRAPLSERLFGPCAACKPIVAAEQAERERAWKDAEDQRSRAVVVSLGSAKSADAAIDLLRLMREMSEDKWCAGWLGGLERVLWTAVIRGESSDLTEAEARKLARMANAAGGWWFWDDALCGENFVAMDAWLKMFGTDDPVVRTVLAVLSVLIGGLATGATFTSTEYAAGYAAHGCVDKVMGR